MSMKMHNQRGDTIVEVLLAIAIVGMVLGASYATANRALRTGRAAQEQTEALKLAESQMEKLKYIAGLTNDKINANNIFAAGGTKFCVDDSFNKVAPCANISGLYTVSNEYVPADNLFRVSVTWIQASGTDGNVQVAYKLYRTAQ